MSSSMQDLGESGFIASIKNQFPLPSSVLMGIGDDAAVTTGPDADTNWIFTSDAVLAGVHFDDSITPAQVGRKLMARNLSDLAAMGAHPCYALINVVVPAETSTDWLTGVYNGLAECSDMYNCAVIGGDTACGPGPQLHLFAIGTCPSGRAVLRSTAKPGDLLYVSGRLGGSLLTGRHATFSPRLKEGQWLREQGLATAMMDISDGLAADLPRLAEASACGFSVIAEQIPLHQDLDDLPNNDRLSGAFNDGEDYELLFTVAASDKEKLESGWASGFDADLHCIGTADDSQNLTVIKEGRTRTWSDKGYEHFRD